MEQLVKSVSIENLLNIRTAILERILQARNILLEAAALGNSCGINDVHGIVDGEDYRRESLFRDGAMEAIEKRMDAKAWTYLMNESGLRTFMDARARDQWTKNIQQLDFPPLTLLNIEATFSNLYLARGDMFERGVLEVFRRLSWSYKTNSPCKFGKRVIVSFLMHSYGHVNSSSTNELDDLMRVFHVMEGKPELDHRNSMYSLISGANARKLTQVENEYLSVRWYKKGTGHVTFKKPELVERLNAILIKHYPGALPPRI